MKKSSISEAKNTLSRLLESVRRGETVLITDRERPVARLEPIGAADRADGGETLSRLERAGVLRLGRGALAQRIVSQAPPRAGQGASAVAALLEERQSGR